MPGLATLPKFGLSLLGQVAPADAGLGTESERSIAQTLPSISHAREPTAGTLQAEAQALKVKLQPASLTAASLQAPTSV